MKRDQDIIDSALAGENYVSIAMRYGVSRSRIQQIAAKAGVRRRLYTRLHALVERDAERLYRAGCNDAEIARQLGCSTTAVRLWRTRNNHPPLLARTDYEPREIMKLYRSGKTFSAIADALGITRSAVAGFLYRSKKNQQRPAPGRCETRAER